MVEFGKRERPNPGRVVADADVLAADLLVGGPARSALDIVRTHTWVKLVGSEALVTDALAIIASLADEALATDWEDRLRRELTIVDQQTGDHPALASARAGNAAHVLTFDEELGSAATNIALQNHLHVSLRTPTAFARVFDAASLHEAVVGTSYPGPDRDPRA